jgi:hypothetical protein
MFTKVPIQHTLDYIEHKLKSTDEWKTTTKLDADEFMDLLKICVKNTYFTWRKTCFKQTEGSPMGSPISPIFCELFMQNLEEQVVKNNINIKFWKRYVDDTFSIIHARKAQQILKALNDFHPNVTFTMEMEENDRLSFLDVTVYRKDNGSLGYKVFRKPTHTNQYLNFASFHHKSQKIAVIDSLVTKALKLSDEDNLDDELKFITHILQGNHYPTTTINSRIDFLKNKAALPQTPKDDKWIALPYTGGLCKRLSRLLRNQLNTNIGYYPGQKLSTILYNFKDKKEKINCGIYQLKCKQCNSQYIGESERDIGIRLMEHEAHTRNNNVKLSAVALHMSQNPGHEIDKDSFGLLERETRYFPRKFKEALYIKKATSTMNSNDGRKINSIWTPTLLPLVKAP